MPETEGWLDLDLHLLARRRRANAAAVRDGLPALEGLARPLWPAPDVGVVPQTFPIVLEIGSRDEVYAEMNARGYGVVSLYHTLSPAVPTERFPEAAALNRQILNLPVHQDLAPEDVPGMLQTLRRILEVA